MTVYEPPEVPLLSGPGVALEIPLASTSIDLSTVTGATIRKVTDPTGLDRTTSWTGQVTFASTTLSDGTIQYESLYQFQGTEVDKLGIWWVGVTLAIAGGSAKAIQVPFRGVP